MNRRLDDETAEQVRVIEQWFGNETPSVEHYEKFVENMEYISRVQQDSDFEIPSRDEFKFACDYINND